MGYPVNRVAISKIEGNLRAGKLDVAELFALAVALEIPPALLLFPSFPDGTVELLPGFKMRVPKAIEWLSGEAPLPVEIHADGVSGHINQRNNGTDLVGLVKPRTDGTGELLEWGITQRRAGRDMAELITEAISIREQELEAVNAEIREARAALWGHAEDNADG